MTVPVPAGACEVRVLDAAPTGWAELLAAAPAAEYTAGTAWTSLAARHYPGAYALWLAAFQGDDLVGGLPLVARRRRGLTRLESSFDGTVGGPQVRGDLPADARGRVVTALGRALAGALTGRTGLAALTLAGPDRDAVATVLAADGWRRHDFESGVVDCRRGLDHVGQHLWTNNRRNERNRGLKRGCTLHAEPDPQALTDWYPLYEAKAHQWAQAPVPLDFMRALLLDQPERCCFDHIRLDGVVVAGHLGFVSRERLIAWQGAARPDLARTHFLTTLLYWRNLMTACERGLQAVDFGGHVGRDTLWEFKRRCGAEPDPRTQLVRRTTYGRAHGWLADAWRRHGASA